MKITIECPECGVDQKVSDSLAGKRTSCKKCKHRFLVTLPRESADDDDERGSRRAKRPANDGAIPVWVWVAGGGAVAFIGLLILVGLIVAVVRSSNRGPGDRPQAQFPNNPAMPAPGGNPMPGGGGASGPHASIVEDFANSWNAAADALSQARDQGSASASANRLRQEATKVEQLTQRLRAAGRVPDADVARVAEIQNRFKASVHRIENETAQLRQRLPGMRLPPNILNDIDQAMKAYGNAGKSFASAARQNLP